MKSLSRILWREFRTLWVAGGWIAGLTVLAVLVAGAFGDNDAPYTAGWIGTAVLGLAAAAEAVTAERDAGTWPLYERLPLTTADLWRHKLLAAALAQAALFAVVTALAFAINGRHAPSRELWLGIGLCIPEALAWGMFAAALLDRTTTAVAGGAAGMLGVYLLLRLMRFPELAGLSNKADTVSQFVAMLEWVHPAAVVRLGLATVALGASLIVLRGLPTASRWLG